MTKIHIVTDSGASFANARVIQQYPLTIVPNTIEIAGQQHRDGIDLTPVEVIKLTSTQSKPPQLHAPSVDAYARTYARLSSTYDAIISIHTSRELSQNWHNARLAAQQLRDVIEVAVVDSQSICAGQGILVRVAAQAIQEGADFEEVVQRTRGAIDRLYTSYYVEDMSYLQYNNLFSSARMLLGTFLDIKPCLSIEEGHLMVTEKVRTRTQALERLIEFLVEFEALEDAVIIQPRTHMVEQTRTLQDRLSMEFPGRHFPYSIYSPSFACLVGHTATGIVVLEREEEAFSDY